MKIRIHLREGNFIDMDAPDDFNIGTMAQSIEITGFFANHMLYIPKDAFLFAIRTDLSGGSSSVVAGMTKQ